jgi:hypothetical protein
MSDNEPVECGDLGAPPCPEHLWLKDAKGAQATCVRCGEKRSVGDIERLSPRSVFAAIQKGRNGRGPADLDLEPMQKAHDQVQVSWSELEKTLNRIGAGTDRRQGT